MKVQVTAPARLEGLRALRLRVSASGRSAWDTAAGAPARAPGPGSSGDTLNQGVRARLRVPSFSSTERAERRFCPRPAGKVTADEGTGRGADALAGSVAVAAGPGPPPQSRAGSACTLDLPWGGGGAVCGGSDSLCPALTSCHGTGGLATLHRALPGAAALAATDGQRPFHPGGTFVTGPGSRPHSAPAGPLRPRVSGGWSLAPLPSVSLAAPISHPARCVCSCLSQAPPRRPPVPSTHGRLEGPRGAKRASSSSSGRGGRWEVWCPEPVVTRGLPSWLGLRGSRWLWA